MPFRHGHEQRRRPVARTGVHPHLHLGGGSSISEPSQEQRLEHTGVPPGAGVVERRPPPVVAATQVGPLSGEEAEDGQGAFAGGAVDGEDAGGWIVFE